MLPFIVRKRGRKTRHWENCCLPRTRALRRSTSPSFLPVIIEVEHVRRRVFIFGAVCSPSDSICESSLSYKNGTFAARLPLYLPFSLLNFLLRVTGHFTQICPAFLHSAKFFRVEVWRADEESRVTTQNPFTPAFTVAVSLPLPGSLLTFCL